MRFFPVLAVWLLLCGCRDIISPQLRSLPVAECRADNDKLVLTAAGKRIVLFKGSAVAVIDGIAVQLYGKTKLSRAGWSQDAGSVDNILMPIVSPRPVAVKRILIDPGHGGSDSGAVSASGIREKDLNLALAARLAKALKSAGFQVMMTRNSDRFATLDERAAMAEKTGADLFISVHHNSSATNPDAAGMETFAPKADADTGISRSRHAHRLAFLIQQEQSGVNRSPGRGVKHAGFKVLRKTRCPAVLIEAGFVSNPAEVKKCASAEQQMLLARAIARAVKSFAAPLR